jgi:hypothetical protein
MEGVYMYICGINPGLAGALAIVDAAGVLIAVHHTPTLALRDTRGTRHDYNLPGMAALLAPYADAGLHVVIHEAQGHARSPGPWLRVGILAGGSPALFPRS